MNEDIDLILAQCLDDIESKRLTVQACLERYPDLAPSLGPALRTAVALRSLPPVQPSPTFRAVAQIRLQKLIAAHQPAPAAPSASVLAPKRQPAWRSLAWRLAAVLVVLSLLGGGTVLAAGDALPDQPLYPVKLAAERVQITLAPVEENRFQVYLQQADRRLAEATAMVLVGKYDRAFQAMVAYDLILREMGRVGIQAANRGRNIAPLVENVREHVARQSAALQRVYNNVPPRSRPAVQRLMNAAKEAQDRLLDALSDLEPSPRPRPTVT